MKVFMSAALLACALAASAGGYAADSQQPAESPTVSFECWTGQEMQTRFELVIEAELGEGMMWTLTQSGRTFHYAQRPGEACWVTPTLEAL